MLKRLVREPLVHFLAIALAIFAAYAVIARPAEAPGGQIVVSAAKIEQLEAMFTQSRLRPPGTEELKTLIDDYVAEELYVREAMELGLDQDDAVIRRRLRQKMEFLIAAEAEAAVPTDAELQAYLDAHPEHFRRESRVAFEQVFLDVQSRGAAAGDEALRLLDELKQGTAADPEALGDPTLLPAEMPLSDLTEIDAVFGPEVSAALQDAPKGDWIGPVTSTFGLHLIRVTDRTDAGVPPLSDVRDTVAREWTNARVDSARKAHLEQLLSQYGVSIEMPEPVKTQ